MNASEQDSTQAADRTAEHGPDGVSSAARDADAETCGDPLPGEAAEREVVNPTRSPTGESGNGSAESQPGSAGADLDAESEEKAGGSQAEGDETDELKAERDRIRDRHLRLAADFDNYRKRTEDRLRQRWDRAQADLVSRLLEPLDDLLRVTALEPGSASVDAIVEGVDLVERKFFRVLEEAGVEVVDPEGEAFDPNTMEAMMRVPAASDEEDDMVEQVFQRGYTFRGRLVRPARVSVFKA